jgi:hypothetical protein
MISLSGNHDIFIRIPVIPNMCPGNLAFLPGGVREIWCHFFVSAMFTIAAWLALGAWFVVVQDQHILTKLLSKSWWEDRSYKLGRVGSWLFLCSSSISRTFPISAVIIAGIVDRYEVVYESPRDGGAGVPSYRAFLREVRILAEPVGITLREGPRIAANDPALQASFKRVLVIEQY